MRRRLLFPAMLLAALFLTVAPARAQAVAGQTGGGQTFLVFFQTSSAELDPAARDVLVAAVTFAKQNPAMRVEIVGYADTDGSTQANMYLSLLRAQLVMDRLAESGVDSGRMTRVGQGTVHMQGSMQASRRVDIVIGAR